jgi:hypothetical protein
VADHILSRQLQISLTCTNTTLARRLDLQIQEITLEWSTADLSHSAGSTAATVDNSLHLATFYVINARSQELQRNPAAQIAGLNSPARQRGTATWHTRNASNDETHRIYTQSFHALCESFLHFRLYCIVWSIILYAFLVFSGGVWGGGIRKILGTGKFIFH